MGRTYHYTYRVKFPDTGHFYYGLHSTKNLEDGYAGSPVTHKWMWDFYDYEVQILEFHESRDKAWSVECRLIAPFLHNPMCLNMNVGGAFSSQAGRSGGLKGGAAVRDSGQLERMRERASKVNPKPIEVTTPEGKVLAFHSTAEAGHALGLNPSAITMVLKGYRTHHHHHTARYT